MGFYLTVIPNVIEVYLEYRHLHSDFKTRDLYELGVRVTDTLLFEVKTIRDAHILLQKDRTDYTTNIVYIIISGWGGSRSAIYIKGENVENNYDINLLSPYEYRYIISNINFRFKQNNFKMYHSLFYGVVFI